MGDRDPELKPGKWLGETPDLGGKPAMIEFFHSLNKHSVERLEELNRIAMDTQGDLVVIVGTREHDTKVQTLLTGGGPAY